MKTLRTLFLLLGSTASAYAASQSPNFLLVYIDDLGWTDTSVEMIKDRPDTKNAFYQTPHLERLAADGIVFSDAYAPAPVCTPSSKPKRSARFSSNSPITPFTSGTIR